MTLSERAKVKNYDRDKNANYVVLRWVHYPKENRNLFLPIEVVTAMEVDTEDPAYELLLELVL